MNLSPALQEAIAEIAAAQGISPEEFIIQTLMEKVNSFQSPASSTSPPMGLMEKGGILVFETEPLNHIDFNALIAESREEASWEQMRL